MAECGVARWELDSFFLVMYNSDIDEQDRQINLVAYSAICCSDYRQYLVCAIPDKAICTS
jgi:hypothetical protein